MYSSIKKYFKNYNFIYNLNAKVKALINLVKLNSLRTYYKREASRLGIVYSEKKAIEITKTKLSERGISPSSRAGKLRIFWVGASQAQDESGFLNGLRNFGEVIIYRDADGGYGLTGSSEDHRCPDIIKTVKKNSVDLLRSVERANSKKKIDLLIGQMWADILDVAALKKIQNLGIVVVNISMDDKLPPLWGEYRGRRMGAVGLASGVDLTLTTTQETCLWYAAEGHPAIYWPLASDPSLFYPRKKKKYDVVFIGSNYGLRSRLVEALEAAGVHVDAFGPGWDNGSRGAEECAEIFGTARIILGTGNIGYNDDIFTIKLRDFDAPMSGALYITHRNPDLLNLFREGNEIECYSSIIECVDKVKYYLTNPEEAQRIAGAGLLRARQNYSWEKRIGETLRLIGFPLSSSNNPRINTHATNL